MGEKEIGARESAEQQLTGFLSTPRANIVFTPEFSQRHFFFSVPRRNAVSSKAYAFIVPEQAQTASALLSTSDDTKCTVLVTDEFCLARVKETFFKTSPELAQMEKEGRLTFHVSGYLKHIWAQDLGQSVRREEGGSEFIVPGLDAPTYEAAGFPVPITPIPLSFQGGDVATTTLNGKKVVVAGPQLLARTMKYYKRNFNYEISDDEIKDVLKHAFSADSVVLLRNPVKAKEPELAIHIDLTVFFPKDGVAVMVDPESITPETPELLEMQKSLRQYRTALEEAGFRIIDIPSTNQHASDIQAYTNAIPITKPDGSTTIIMPSFGDSALERRIRSRLEKEGMKVVFTRNRTFSLGGNTHCITGGLARAEEVYRPKPKTEFQRKVA